MLCVRPPQPSLMIATGAEMGSNYGGMSHHHHHGGSFSPSSSSTSSSSSPSCPSTPSSSYHSFNMQHNHFQQNQMNGDATPLMGKQYGMGWNGEKKQQRIVNDQRKGRGGGSNNWLQRGNNFMPPPPFFGSHPPPFPPPPGHLFPFPPPPSFINGCHPPPPMFPPPPTYNQSRGSIDTSIPPPPYTVMPPFMMGGPPPPPPNSLFFNPNGGMGQNNHQHPYQYQQERMESRPSSRGEEGGGSLESTDLSYGEHSQDGSYETSSPDDDSFIGESAPADINQGKRSYLVNLRPKSKRDEAPAILPLFGNKEFATFKKILTGGNNNVKETDIMDNFIVEYMKHSEL